MKLNKQHAFCVLMLLLFLFCCWLFSIKVWSIYGFLNSFFQETVFASLFQEKPLNNKRFYSDENNRSCFSLYAVLLFKTMPSSVNGIFQSLSSLLGIPDESFHFDNVTTSCGLPLFFCNFSTKNHCSSKFVNKFSSSDFKLRHCPDNINVLSSYEFNSAQSQRNGNLTISITWQISSIPNCDNLVYKDVLHLLSSYEQLFQSEKLEHLFTTVACLKIISISSKPLDFALHLPPESNDSPSMKASSKKFTRVRRSSLKQSNIFSIVPVTAVALPVPSSIKISFPMTPDFGPSKNSTLFVHKPPSYVGTSDSPSSFSDMMDLTEHTKNSVISNVVSYQEGSGFSGSEESAFGSGGSNHLVATKTTNSYTYSQNVDSVESYSSAETTWFPVFTSKTLTNSVKSYSSAVDHKANMQTILNLFSETESSGTPLFNFETTPVIPTPRSFLSNIKTYKGTTISARPFFHPYSGNQSQANRNNSAMSTTIPLSDKETTTSQTVEENKYVRTNFYPHTNLPMSTFTSYISSTQLSKDMKDLTSSSITHATPPVVYKKTGPKHVSVTAVYGKLFVYDIPAHWKPYLKSKLAIVDLSDHQAWYSYNSTSLQVVGVPVINAKNSHALLISLLSDKQRIEWPTAVLLKVGIYRKTLNIYPSYFVQTNCTVIKDGFQTNKTTSELVGMYSALFIRKVVHVLPHIQVEDLSLLKVSQAGFANFNQANTPAPEFYVTWFIEKFDSRTFLKHYKPLLVEQDDKSGTKELFFALLPEFVLEFVTVTQINSTDELAILLPGFGTDSASSGVSLSVVLPVSFILFFMFFSTLILIVRHHRKKNRFNRSILIDRTFARRRKPVCLREEVELDQFQPSKPRILHEDLRSGVLNNTIPANNNNLLKYPFSERPSSSISTVARSSFSSSQHSRSSEELDNRTSGSYSFVDACFTPGDDSTSIGSDVSTSFVYDSSLLAKKGD